MWYNPLWQKAQKPGSTEKSGTRFWYKTIFPEKHPKNPKNQRYWRIFHDICRFTSPPFPIGVVEAASSSLVTQTKKTSRLFLLVFLYFTRVFGTFSVSENPFFLASGFASFWLDFGVSTYLGTYLKKVHFTNE